MFTNLTVQGYRPFKKLTIDPLARVNLIAGANDVGKTALLEAVFLLVAEGNLTLLPMINGFRGLGDFRGDPDMVSDWLWSPLFHNFSLDRGIKIEGSDSRGTRHGVQFEVVARSSEPVTIGEKAIRESGSARYGFSLNALRMTYFGGADKQRDALMVVDRTGVHVDPAPPTPSTPSYFLASRGRIHQEEVAKDFGDLDVLGRPYDVEPLLRILEPRLRRISTIVGPGGSMLYGDVGLGRMLPLALLGDGVARLATVLLKIATNARGVVIVDEMENGLYHGVITKVWTAIGEAATLFDVQIFATTHSWECIRAAHEAFSARESYDFRLHRLERIGDDIRAVTYDQEALDAALKAGLEVR